MKKIAIAGAGGFGEEVFCIWRDYHKNLNIEFNFLGFFDDDLTIKGNNYGKVIGKISDLNNIKEDVDVGIAIGNPKVLNEIIQQLENPNISFPNIMHTSSFFLDEFSLKIGRGNIFSVSTIISCGVEIGDFNIFNTRATIGHHSKIGNFNVFGPNAQISGNVKIKNLNNFGFDCGIIQNKNIGSGVTIGVGSKVLRSIKDEGLYLGSPAKKIKL